MESTLLQKSRASPRTLGEQKQSERGQSELTSGCEQEEKTMYNWHSAQAVDLSNWSMRE